MKNILVLVFTLIFGFQVCGQEQEKEKNENEKKEKKQDSVSSGDVSTMLVMPIEPDPGGGGGTTYPWNRDYDGDGYGDPDWQTESSTQPSGYVANRSDCDDYNSNIYPGAPELADGKDNDCDGMIDEGISAPAMPSSPTVTKYCGYTRLTRGTPPTGVTWYWQSSSSGTSTSSSSSYINLYSGTVYYLRARDNNNLLWSSSRSVSYTIDVATTWYYDGDGDGFGDPAVTTSACSQPTNYVSNANDNCPSVSGLNNGCPSAGGDVTELINTLQIKLYDRDGNIKGKTKSYFDDLGNTIQVQSLDIKTGKTWASHTLYDAIGRPALTTLSAPTNQDIPGDFLYRSNFIKKSDNTTYTSTDFENTLVDPLAVGNQENSLGWYYSSANTSEPYQDVTDRPYSRTIYSDLNPGKILKTVGGNKKAGEWKNTYSFSMIAGQELAQSVAFNNSIYNTYKIQKIVARDVNGIENVIFLDADGKTLGAARSGGSTSRSMNVKIGDQGFVDVHVPVGSNAIGFSVTKPSNINIKISDLITEKLVTSTSSSLTNGFYRISITNLESYNPSSPVTITYKENYYDYSLNKYDNAGNLIKTYQPLNKLESSFEYNSLGQLLYANSPDEGESWFKYMRDGRIRYSQNSEQLLAGKFSYTDYDNIGRPIESGVINNFSFSTINPNNSLPSGVRSEQQFTVYDKLEQSDLNFLSGVNSTYANPSFLIGNIAKSKNNNVSSFYSYDVYGRVKWMVQNIAGLGAKTIDYTYDAVTGAVTLVDYQKYTAGERFSHRYTYNNLGQLVKVETSTNSTTFLTQVTYEYYESGALKRKVLGNGIQGIDYVYNLNGSLKSINHPELTSTKDPGGDSNDLFGMTIHYNDQDYLRTNTPKTVGVTSLGTEQYNGNIKGIEWKTQGSTAANYFYEYDRNSWLTRADFNLGQGSTDYRVDNLTYDANGNIKSLRRNKHTQSGSNIMDNLTYRYKPGKNQLEYVDDAVTSLTNANDIKDQVSNNYSYNKIGQLVSNAQEGITYTYNTSGLVTKVQMGANNVEFFYDDRGQRIKKVATTAGIVSTSFYVRDATGNALSIYTGGNMEHTIFGISRIGVAKRTIGQTSLAEQNYFYELTDHLGNVRAIVQKQTNGNILAIAKTDYYPFGMTMPGRDVQGDYRYSYQGQEKDSETGMEAFELRLWDSRIGRWLTTDPYGQFTSPYIGMGNNPISMIDPDGGAACPDPPCTGVVNALPEVIITGSGRGGFDFSDMPNWINNLDVGHYNTSFSGDLSAYNKKYGTNYTEGSQYNQYYYQNFYKKEYDDLISSIHGATSEAAEYMMYIMPTPLVGANIAFKGIPALAKGYKYTDDAIQVVQLGGNLGLHQLKRFGINKSYNFYTSLPRGIRRAAYPLQKGLNIEQNIFRSYLSPSLPKQIDNVYKNINNFRKFFD